jgi:diguanylate cyclase (GGDEF)-like protein/PAS domain S-box-containing protein
VSYLDEYPLSWQHLVEVLPDGVALVDEGGDIRYANERLITLSGYSLEQLVGLAVAELVPSGDVPARAARRKRRAVAAATDERSGAERHLVRVDGGDVPVTVSVSPLTIAERAWRLVIIRDDSERRQAERSRAEMELRFRLAFEDNMAPMIFTDLEDRVMAANEAFCHMVGLSLDEVLGFDSKPFTFPEDIGITEESLRHSIHEVAEQTRYVKRYMHKNGRLIWVEVSRSPALDDEGRILYFVISERDITDRVNRDMVLRLRSEVNRVALSASTELEFLQQVCDVLVGVGGYALAWIAIIPLIDNGGAEIVCAAGATDYLYGDRAAWWGTPESGRGIVGRALHTSVTEVVNDPANTKMNEPWRERAEQFKFRSWVAIPDRYGTRRAALLVHDYKPFAFDQTTVEGLEEIVRESELAVVHVRSVNQTAAALEETTLAIKELHDAEHALGESELRFRLAFEDNMAPMVFSDLEDRAIAVNDAFCRMVGFEREELLGHDSKQFTFPEDIGITEEHHARLSGDGTEQIRYVKRYLRKDGRVIVSEVSRSAARDESGNTLYFVSSERDITEERALTDQLSHQALHDPLTGLANRVLFDDRLLQAHARCVRDQGIGAVLLLDLDDFKGVNDTHGHLVGDQLLMGIARRFEMVTRSSDTLCRFGGDEFLYLAEGLDSADEAEEVARRLLATLDVPFSFDGLHLAQHASIGIVVWDALSTDSAEFVQNADVALYEAKALKRGGYAVFTPSMHQKAISRFEIVQELRHALQVGELSMHYQPIVDLATTDVVGFEALMRWDHPERGWVAPGIFIPLAEQSELILELGKFALREAVNAASTWEPSGPGEHLAYVSVNLSAHQFRDPGLVAIIEEALATSGLAPDRLVIEITERAALIDVNESVSVIQHLDRLGIGIALDDFGTGYSSLSYLALLHPRVIKIDQSFVSPVDGRRSSDTLLETMISLGNKLDMTMLAEGIETVEQLELLRDLGCELGQGFLFSAAVPAKEIAHMIDLAPSNWSMGSEA